MLLGRREGNGNDADVKTHCTLPCSLSHVAAFNHARKGGWKENGCSLHLHIAFYSNGGIRRLHVPQMGSLKEKWGITKWFMPEKDETLSGWKQATIRQDDMSKLSVGWQPTVVWDPSCALCSSTWNSSVGARRASQKDDGWFDLEVVVLFLFSFLFWARQSKTAPRSYWGNKCHSALNNKLKNM